MRSSSKQGSGMKWRPVPAEMSKMFAELVAVLPPDVEQRKMFGCPCVFANGHMFSGLFQESLFVRLPPAERETLLQREGAVPFEPMAGRIMREYVVLPPATLASHNDVIAWMEKGLAYVRSLPPKR